MNKINESNNNNNSKLKEKILKLISESSMSYNLKPFSSDRFISRIFWIIFIYLLMSLCGYYIVLNVNDYLRYDTVTSIHTISEKKAQFPTISFCRFDRSDHFEFKVSYFYFNFQDLLSEWQNHFDTYNDTVNGLCYRFNSGKNLTGHLIPFKNSTFGGFDNAFILNFYSTTKYDYGQMQISIKNHTINPNSIYNTGDSISAGCFNYFLVKRTFDEKLAQPYNQCYKNVSLFSLNKTLINFIESKNRLYTQTECIRLCQNLYFKENSDCDCIFDDIDKELWPTCYLGEEKSSVYKCTQKFIANFQENIKFEVCPNYCPLECDSFTYDISLKVQPVLGSGNFSSYNETESLNEFSEFISFENFSKNFYSVSVFYDDLKYTLISQQPKTEIFGLLSNMGGILGLFLGLSAVSFLELFEIVMEVCLYLLENKNCKAIKTNKIKNTQLN